MDFNDAGICFPQDSLSFAASIEYMCIYQYSMAEQEETYIYSSKKLTCLLQSL
jgi:hypothetical protein